MLINKPRAILFDFDGTLADTAPDLIQATQNVLRSRGHAPVNEAALRQVCSAGARGLLGLAFGISKDHVDFEPLRQAFLNEYKACLTQHTQLFSGVDDVLKQLQTRQIAWGIVTNKATDLTVPIVQAILIDRGWVPSTVVCGDTTPHTKPHPAPVLHACQHMGIDPQHTWYVGDDRRDVQAALAALCTPIAVTYGYHSDQDPPHTWGSPWVLDQPSSLMSLLDNAQ